MNYKAIKQASFFYCKSIVFGILALAYLVSGCSEDLYEENMNFKGIRMRKIALTDTKVQNNKSLMREINKIVHKEKGLQQISRIVYDSVYNFYFDDQEGVCAEMENGKETYTFKITRFTNPNDSKLENIIFEKKGNEFESFIIKYDFTADEKIKLQNGIPFESVEAPEINYYSKIKPCNTIIDKCVIFISPDTGEIVGTEITYLDPCTGSGGSGGLSGGSSSSEGSGSSGGLGNGGVLTGGGVGTTGSPTYNNPSDPNVLITSPVGHNGNSNQPFPDTPCGRIQKGTSSNAYKQKFKALNKPSKFTLPYETGFAQKKENGALSYFYLQAASSNSLKFPSGSLNFTHVHNIHMVIDEDGNEYDGGIKILSPEDVGALITTCQTASENAAINPTEAFGVMISNEGIFAITLLEPLSINEIGQFNSNLAVFKIEYELKAGNIVQNPNLDATGRKNALQKMLLSLLKKYGLENKVGLFEGEAQDNFDSYDINWTKKALNPTNPNATPVETPC